MSPKSTSQSKMEKRYPFCEKWYIKGKGGWTLGRSLPIQKYVYIKFWGANKRWIRLQHTRIAVVFACWNSTGKCDMYTRIFQTNPPKVYYQL